MCGIAGYVGDFIPGLAARMSDLLAHRGPDGRATFEDAPAAVALGHTRLAILDLSEHADQPMLDPSGRFVLVYNGEIYNFEELQRSLGDPLASYASSGDTEVLLRGLARRGAAFLEQLNGMFALALWDRQERELLLARDPLGIKPLYCAEPRPGALLFASEIKALCAHPGLRREPDFEVLREHLTFGHACGERTALKGVRRLPPGTVQVWRAGHGAAPPQRYWAARYGGEGTDRAAAAGELRSAIQEACARQLVSDVPVGSFLSGGLDSSLITTCAASRAGESLECFTITYPAADNVLDRFVDDAPYARSLARSLGLHLHEIEIQADVAALLPELVYYLDEPLVDPAAIAAYLISREASARGTTVLLSGQGADELFGGYPRYQAMHATRPLDLLPRFLRRGLAHAADHLLPGALPGSAGATARRVRRVLSGLRHDPDERFLAYCAASAAEEAARVFAPELRAELGAGGPTEPCLCRMSESRLSGMDRFLERDLTCYLPNHNLAYMDRMGMAAGLEVRVPLLDLEIVELATPLPARWKVRGQRTKAILREAARGLVPQPIVERPKAGFGAPYRKWLRHDLEEMWLDLTSERAVERRGWFDHAALERARRESQSGRSDLYMLQWAVLTVELWARSLVDYNPTARLAQSSPGPVAALS